MQATFVRIDDEAKNIKTLWFKPEKPLHYIAGQFTEVRLPIEQPDNRGDKRWFTLSSSPTDELVSITTRLDPERPSTFKQTLFGLQPGAQLTLAEPMGDFVLPKKKDIPLVFVAGGIGITPMHSMITWLVDTGEQRQISLFYAANTLEDMVFLDVFEKAPITFEPIPSHPPQDWEGRTGRLTSDAIASLPGVKDNALVYVSGPEPMVEAFYKELQDKGVAQHRLVMDYFPGYTEANI